MYISNGVVDHLEVTKPSNTLTLSKQSLSIKLTIIPSVKRGLRMYPYGFS